MPPACVRGVPLWRLPVAAPVTGWCAPGRFTWEIIRRHRAGRVVVLTTHRRGAPCAPGAARPPGPALARLACSEWPCALLRPSSARLPAHLMATSSAADPGVMTSEPTPQPPEPPALHARQPSCGEVCERAWVTHATSPTFVSSLILAKAAADLGGVRFRVGQNGRRPGGRARSMEEADVLADRIAILAAGRLAALGSAMDLKARFGVGYTLTLARARPSAPSSACGPRPRRCVRMVPPPGRSNVVQPAPL